VIQLTIETQKRKRSTKHKTQEFDVLSAWALELVDKEFVNTFNKVDFPAPEGPRIAETLPSGNRRFISYNNFFPLVVDTLSINAYPSFIAVSKDGEVSTTKSCVRSMDLDS